MYSKKISNEFTKLVEVSPHLQSLVKKHNPDGNINLGDGAMLKDMVIWSYTMYKEMESQLLDHIFPEE